VKTLASIAIMFLCLFSLVYSQSGLLGLSFKQVLLICGSICGAVGLGAALAHWRTRLDR